MSDFNSKIESGMSVLDEYFGTRQAWTSQIDLEDLDLGDCSVCVLGQLFGGYSEGLDALSLDSGHSYGFDTVSGMSGLTAAWKEALGKNNVLVEKGDIYKDVPGCCMIKVVSTQTLTLTEGGSPTSVYIVQRVDEAGKALYGSTLITLFKKDFEQGGSYPNKVKLFTFKKGQFVTNDTGKVYYVLSLTEAREIKDQAYTIRTSEIDTKGLREVKLPSGKLFSDTVK